MPTPPPSVVDVYAKENGGRVTTTGALKEGPQFWRDKVPLLLLGCHTGADMDASGHAFSNNGSFDIDAYLAIVTGFQEESSNSGCYAMRVVYEETKDYCFHVSYANIPSIPNPFDASCRGWTQATPRFVLARDWDVEWPDPHWPQRVSIYDVGSYTRKIHENLTPTPTPTPPPTPAPTPTPPPPAPALDALRTYMLVLINDARVKAGVGPVTLGDSIVAQLHAEDQRDNCYSGHWDSDGLKPHMRYSFAGGYQANKENTSGLDACLSGFYTPIGNLYEEVDQTMALLLRSDDHKASLLEPNFHTVNIGLAYDRYILWVTQQFGSGYILDLEMPVFRDGILTLKGTTADDVVFGSPEDISVRIYRDPLPHPLTTGQLVRTYCVGLGSPVFQLRPEAPPGYSYPSSPPFFHTEIPCVDPYEIPPDASVPQNESEAHRVYAEARNAIENIAAQMYFISWVDTAWKARGNTFEIRADLKSRLESKGPGVYTAVVWGPTGRGQAVILTHSFLVESVR